MVARRAAGTAGATGVTVERDHDTDEMVQLGIDFPEYVGTDRGFAGSPECCDGVFDGH